jgi:hypothetical protein
MLHTGTSDPTVEVMDGGLGGSASRRWPPHGETELTGDRLQIGQCAGDGGHRNDNTIIYYGQRAEAEIQNGQLFLPATVHSRRLTERGGAQLLYQVIEVMEYAGLKIVRQSCRILCPTAITEPPPADRPSMAPSLPRGVSGNPAERRRGRRVGALGGGFQRPPRPRSTPRQEPSSLNLGLARLILLRPWLVADFSTSSVAVSSSHSTGDVIIATRLARLCHPYGRTCCLDLVH